MEQCGTVYGMLLYDMIQCSLGWGGMAGVLW
jgi:hypothetical protein